MKKRMLAVLTTLAMLISMCSISVYAEDTGVVEGLREYEYTVKGAKQLPGTVTVSKTNQGIFGGSSNLALTKFTVKNERIGNKDLDFNSPDKTHKELKAGDTIVVSYSAALDNLMDAVSIRFGITGTVKGGTETTNKYFTVKPFDGKLYTSNLKDVGDFGSDCKPTGLLDVVQTPTQKLVKYDVVIKVGENGNTASFYADGRPFFENKDMGIEPYESVQVPYVRISVEPIKNADNILYVSDVSMTIYSKEYTGTIVEKNPLTTDTILPDGFEREGDGSIVYKGLRLLSNADEDLIADENWTAQYVGADGYMRIKKGDTTYYYEKASETISNININNMDVNVGKKEWKVKVRNIEDNSISPVVLLASFVDDEMVKCAYSDPSITIEPDETKEIDVSLDVSEGENVNTIKIFIFDSFETLTPLKMERQTSKK